MDLAEDCILVLQGGGALGAYQAGAYEQLAAAGRSPDWVAGISIGAINAALICGNRPKDQLAALHAFWDRVTSRLTATPWILDGSRTIFGEIAAASAAVSGVPGFFRPRNPLGFLTSASHQPLSFYDTMPLRETLLELVDFDYLNAAGPRLSVGAVDVETANFAYFDSHDMRITPEHIMASGALPPGFAPVEIEGRFYWDGGLVSNTPLQYVMDALGEGPVCIFQVDLFSARGSLPKGLTEVGQRTKDIQYSSRTRLTTDRYRQLHAIRAAAIRLSARLPEEMRDDPDLLALTSVGPDCPITLVELIHRKDIFEGDAKDYEFSRISMTEHWHEGGTDVQRTLASREWKHRKPGQEGLQLLDVTSPTGERPHMDRITI